MAEKDDVPSGATHGDRGLDFTEVHRVLSEMPGLEVFLNDLTSQVVDAVPGTDACSLMLRRDGEPLTAAGSDPIAAQLDERQYAGRYDEGMGGPCLTSVASGREQRVCDTAHEERWKVYADFARELGVGSALAVPLRWDGERLGALNLYAERPHVFDEDTLAAHRLAAQAEGAIRVALRIDAQAQEAEDLRTAMLSRSVIDQAIGIVMARAGGDAAAALETLSRASQNKNVKLRDLAAELVSQVSGRPPQPGRFRPRR